MRRICVVIFAIGARSRARTKCLRQRLGYWSLCCRVAADHRFMYEVQSQCGVVQLWYNRSRIDNNGSLWRRAIRESNGCIARRCCCRNGPCRWRLVNADGFACCACRMARICATRRCWSLMVQVRSLSLPDVEGTLDPGSKSAQSPPLSLRPNISYHQQCWWTYHLDSRAVSIIAGSPIASLGQN
jgi:hypothetical protein